MRVQKSRKLGKIKTKGEQSLCLEIRYYIKGLAMCPLAQFLALKTKRHGIWDCGIIRDHAGQFFPPWMMFNCNCYWKRIQKQSKNDTKCSKTENNFLRCFSRFFEFSKKINTLSEKMQAYAGLCSQPYSPSVHSVQFLFEKLGSSHFSGALFLGLEPCRVSQHAFSALPEKQVIASMIPHHTKSQHGRERCGPPIPCSNVIGTWHLGCEKFCNFFWKSHMNVWGSTLTIPHT